MSTAIDQVLLDAVEAGVVPSVAAIVADRNGVIYEGAVGYREVGGLDPVSTATHFRIMSMTKMVATAAALQQIERGKLDISAPVAQYCPEFAGLQVLDGFDGDTPRLRPPASQATVHQLLTHTAGLGYWFFNAELVRWHEATGIPNVLAGLNSIVHRAAAHGPGHPLQLRHQHRLAGPRGRGDHRPDPGRGDQGEHHRAARHERDDLHAERRAAGQLHAGARQGRGRELDLGRGDRLNPHPEWMAAGHGLYSTPRDYIKFQRALLRGGELDGERILAPETVDMAFTNQIGDLEFPPELLTCDPAATNDFVAGPGWKWGYGLLLNPEDAPGHAPGAAAARGPGCATRTSGSTGPAGCAPRSTATRCRSPRSTRWACTSASSRRCTPHADVHRAGPHRWTRRQPADSDLRGWEPST